MPSTMVRCSTQAGTIEDCKLFSFQQSDVAFLLASKQALLCTPCGGGKTIVSIVAARLTHGQHFLVVTPASMRQTWKMEIEKWWPGAPVHIIEGTAAQRAKKFGEIKETGGWVIINWEALRLCSRLAPYGSIRLSDKEKTMGPLNDIPFDIVIADEIHRAKSPTSKAARALWYVGHGPTVRYRWGLTGTPLTSKLDSLWSLLHFISPEEHPSKTAFISRYCEFTQNYWGPGITVTGLNESTKDEFFEVLDPRFRRLPKEIILPQLPPIQYIRRYIDMSPEQARSYRTMAADMVALDENGELIVAVNPVSKLTRTIQYSSANVEVVERIPDPETGNIVTKVKLTDPSNKLDALMDDLPDYLAAGESVVVFAVHRQLIEMAEGRLQDKKIPYSVIKGSQSSEFRQKQVDQFQDGTVSVCLAVLAAGSTGINLHKSRIALFLQRPWSNIEHQQAMGRVHRIGSEVHDSVLIVDYISPGTSEIGQMDVLAGKMASLEEVVRDRESIVRLLNGEAMNNE